ncbi:MAG: hemerythrin domain-containing protein [Nitriliruptorales bacterium]
MATIIVQLRRDHEDIQRTLDKIRTADISGLKRQVLTGDTTREIRRHTRAESDVVEPVAREMSKGDQTSVAASTAEHAAIDELLTRLSEYDVHTPDFISALDELMTKVETHVKAYEDHVIPRLEALDDDRRDDLGLKFVRVKDEADNLMPPPDADRRGGSE